MTLTWEAVTALATAISALVVAITVALGYRQLRVTGDQLRQVRLGTQLDGTMRIFEELDAEEFRAARLFVFTELAERMDDASFRRGVGRVGRADEHDHRELVVLRMFEKIGSYVKHGLLDGAVIYDYAGPWIVSAWRNVNESGVVTIHRAAFGPTIWENFAWLNGEAAAWIASNGGDPAVYANPPESEAGRSGPPSEREE